MMYNLVREDIYGVFASDEFKALSIKVNPDTFQVDAKVRPFIRLTIIPANSEFTSYSYDKKKLSGYMILAIFVETKQGHKGLFNLADTFDSLFENKKLSNGTCFMSSKLDVKGVDQHDSSLYRGDYMIKFNYYGE
jgi:hypothetical protein